MRARLVALCAATLFTACSIQEVTFRGTGDGGQSDAGPTGPGQLDAGETDAGQTDARLGGPTTQTLGVAREGSGHGTVTAPGIDCGGDCEESYAAGTDVTLTAEAADDSIFTGWSGADCPGTGTCTVTMSEARTVTARFTLRDFVLTVSTVGNGTVESVPTGIHCGAMCSLSYPAGMRVALQVTPGSGSAFVRWTGACSGSAACEVTMAGARSVTAEFSPINALLAVSNFRAPVGIQVFAASASGDVTPLHVITSITFRGLRGMTVANNELIVADHDARAINVFPTTASGPVEPVRRISGFATQLRQPTGVVVFGDEIYVCQQDGTIVVFPRGATGEVAPSRTITGLGQSQYLAIAGGEIYAAQFNANQIAVFPASTSGAVVPTRIIGGALAGLRGPAGVLVHNGELFVSNRGSNEIRVFPQGASSDMPPLRVIGGGRTELNVPDQMAIFAGEIYVANEGNHSVTVFPINARDNVAPARRFVGANTNLSSPLGAFVF